MKHTAIDSVSGQTLAGQVYDALKRDILRGVLMPGAALLTRDLLQRYRCGISPLREALARLVGEDLLIANQHRGVRVPLPSVEDVEDVYRIRIALEREALALALKHGDDAWEGAVLAAGHQLEKSPLPDNAEGEAAAIERWEARHRGFHNALIAAAPAPRLLRLISQMVDHTERYRVIRLKHDDVATLNRNIVTEHRELMTAAIARDTRCMDLLAGHLQRTCDVAIAVLRQKA